MVTPTCVLIGDSIALGLAAAIKALGAGLCLQSALTGASTAQLANTIPLLPVHTAIVAVGSNDAQATDLDQRLSALRARLNARSVLWVLPYDRRAAGFVRATAAGYRDSVVDLIAVPSRDNVHPASYRGLAVAVTRSGFVRPIAAAAVASAAPAGQR